MNWHSFSDFVHMGGYGLYVWGTFTVTAVTFLCEILVLRTQKRRLQNEVLDGEEGEA